MVLRGQETQDTVTRPLSAPLPHSTPTLFAPICTSRPLQYKPNKSFQHRLVMTLMLKPFEVVLSSRCCSCWVVHSFNESVFEKVFLSTMIFILWIPPESSQSKKSVKYKKKLCGVNLKKLCRVYKALGWQYSWFYWSILEIPFTTLRILLVFIVLVSFFSCLSTVANVQ